MKDRLTDLAYLWMRVAIGLGLMVHGWFKLSGDVDRFAASVGELGFPVPVVFAWLAIAAEVIGGFFLVLGLWTRYAAGAIAFAMAVAAFLRHAPDPWIQPGRAPTKELALLYLVVAVALMLTGPGRYSVDAGRGGGKPAPKKKSKA